MFTYRIIVIIGMTMFYFATLNGQELSRLSDAERTRLQTIIKELDSAKWQRSQLVVLAFHPESILPKGYVGQVTERESSVPKYMVSCTKADEKKPELIFEVGLCRNITQANESVFRYFLTVSAPIAHLKNIWAQQKVAYGDVSLGRGLWITGNAVFALVDGRDKEQSLDTVFSTISKRINETPALEASIKSASWQVSYVPEAKAWDIELTNVPPKSLVVVKGKGVVLDRTGDMKARIYEVDGIPQREATLIVTDVSGVNHAAKIELSKNTISTTTNSAAGLWDIPGLTETKDDMSMLLVSDRIPQWLKEQRKAIKSISENDSDIAKDDMRYALANIWVIEGNQGRWQVDIYQANSRQHAHAIAFGFIEMISSRPTANVQWNDKKTGDVSVGYHVGGEETAWRGVVFVRGNIAVKISSEPVKDGKYYDSRPIATMIDSYLIDEPKMDNRTAKIIAITLALNVDKAATYPATAVVGKPCVVTLSPAFRINEKATSATQPTESMPASNSQIVTASEMRVCATHAEMLKLSDETVQITFLAAGKQTVKCYYIDNDGKVVAYGDIAVMVEKEP